MVELSLSPDLEHDRDIGAVSVGRGTYLDSARFYTYVPDERIVIGRYCSIAQDVCISAGGNHRPELPSTWPFDNFLLKKENPTRTYNRTYNQSGNTSIGSDVWIGDGAHIGGGVNVAHGAVIGAKTVAFSDVPAYAIVIGNPARILRYRFSQDQISALLKIEWWNWSPELIRARMEWFYLPIDSFIAEFAANVSKSSPVETTHLYGLSDQPPIDWSTRNLRREANS